MRQGIFAKGIRFNVTNVREMDLFWAIMFWLKVPLLNFVLIYVVMGMQFLMTVMMVIPKMGMVAVLPAKYNKVILANIHSYQGHAFVINPIFKSIVSLIKI